MPLSFTKVNLSDNQIVKRAIPRLDKNIVKDISAQNKKGAGGRKRKYTPIKMRNQINSYFELCEATDEVPSIKGLMIHLKMYKDTFYTYIEYPEFKDMLEHTRLIISNWIDTDIYHTKGLAAGKIAYAKNLHGWSDKIETSNQTTTTVISVDQARAKIEMLAPKLLELLKNNTVLSQIGTKDKVIEAELSPRRIN